MVANKVTIYQLSKDMNKFLLLASVALLCGACTTVEDGHINNAAHSTDKIVNSPEGAATGILLARLNSTVDEFNEVSLNGIDVSVEPLFPTTDGSMLEQWIIVRFDHEADPCLVAEALAADSRVDIVEYSERIKRIKSETMPMPTERPDITRSVEMPFNDPELPYQWHYYNDGSLDDELTKAGADINLFDAWKYTTGDRRIIVAVIDGGIMTNHVDLADNMWVNEAEQNGTPGVDDDGNGYVDDIHGYNFVWDKGEITPDAHGTHVAGTISAVNNNGILVSGIAGGSGNNDGVLLMSCQIFDGDDGCYAHQIAKAFKYAADNGAAICNNSWGYTVGAYLSDKDFESVNSVLKDAINYYETNGGLEGVMDGGLAIFAAANESKSTPSYPGAYHKYVCVTAMAPDYTAAYYTNYGPGSNICAPGGDASYGAMLCVSSTSTDEYGYSYEQGTSMACPHVTGCAALALSYAIQNGYSFTNSELRNMLLTSVHDIDKYQIGYKDIFDWQTGQYNSFDLGIYQGKLGSGYIDAHLLLMQISNTPCLYIDAGEQALCSLDEYFGDASSSLTYLGVDVSEEAKKAVGVVGTPSIENGKLKIKCSKRGTARISVRAIVGGSSLGGGNNMGGMEVTREFEIVVRQSTAKNGGWL